MKSAPGASGRRFEALPREAGIPGPIRPGEALPRAQVLLLAGKSDEGEKER